jgi:prevent-host-death family protein
LDAARLAPVVVTKYDKPFVVVMSADEYEKITTRASLRVSLQKRNADGKKE